MTAAPEKQPALSIAPLCPADYADWAVLWDGNNGMAIDPAITAQTWARLCDPASPVNGLLARDGNGAAAGLVHYILHPVTGNLHPACYMQDLYVNPAHRQQGIGAALVTTLAARARHAGWARLYWLAEAHNESAQTLYRKLGVRLDFTFHVMPL